MASPLLSLPAHMAELVLAQLPLTALGRLSATCTGLRTLVNCQPQATWKAAAGRAGCGKGHPVHTAVPSVQAYLRRQRATAANITASRCRVIHSQQPMGILSPDGTQLATVEAAAGAMHLHVTPLHDSALPTQRWRLPFRVDYLDHASGHAWDVGSSTLALCAGLGWGVAGDATHQAEGDPADIVLLDLATGAHHEVSLGLQQPLDEDLEDDDEQPLQAALLGWSSAGLLLAVHWDAAEESRTFSVFDRAGRKVASLMAPLAPAQDLLKCASWVPCEPNLVLLASGFNNDQLVWLWRASAWNVLQQISLGGHRAHTEVASPAGHLVLCLCERGACLVRLADLSFWHQEPEGLTSTSAADCKVE